MKYRKSTLFFCLFTVLFAHAQNDHDKSEAFSFVDSMLQKGRAKMEIVDVVFPTELQAILERFQNATSKDPDWMASYVAKNSKPGESLPYHEKFGISKEEYQKIIDFGKGPKSVAVIDSAYITIERSNGVISFSTTEEKTKFLEFLNIDLKNHLIIFNRDTIPFDKVINAPSTTAFGEWKGYEWRKEVFGTGEIKLNHMNSSSLKIDFGRVTQNGKKIFRFEYREISDGKAKINLKLSGFLFWDDDK